MARQKFKTIHEDTPLKSATFLTDFQKLLKIKFNYNNVSEAVNPNVILTGLEHLCAFLLDKTLQKYIELQEKGLSTFDTRNNIQVFNANVLAICYAQYNVFRIFNEFVQNIPIGSERNVMEDLVILHGSNLVIRNSGLFYQSGYFNKREDVEIYEKAILGLLEKLKGNAVSLIDSITYPDFIINSCLGNSDGEVYKHLESSLLNAKGTFERPEWWRDICYKETWLDSKL